MPASSTILKISIDGAARGNPGPAGAGVVIADVKGKTLKELSLYLGETTNNVAEYAALLCALQEAVRLKGRDVTVQTDSELLARQVGGQYRVKDATLRVLHALARQLMDGFDRCTVHHVPRERNRAADRLANRAVDAGLRAQGKSQRTFQF